MKVQILLSLLIAASSLVATQAYAGKCRAWLYRANGVQIGQFTKRQGCQEARNECLQRGRIVAPYGYCKDKRGTVVYVNGGGHGTGGGYRSKCDVILYVRGGFARDFRARNCRKAMKRCRNYAMDNYHRAFDHGRTECVRDQYGHRH